MEPAVLASLMSAVLLPLLAAPLVFVGGGSGRYTAVVVSAAVLGAAMCLAAAAYASTGPLSYELGGWSAPLGIAWRLDALTATMLMAVGLVALPVALFSCVEVAAVGGPTRQRRFWPLFLLLLGGLNALFLSGDLFNIYVALEVVSLAAVALVVVSGTAEALRAALRYLLIALVGSLTYLLGVAIVYGGYGVLDLALLSERLVAEPEARLAFVLMATGLFAKTALFPLHVWLAPAHGNAPTAASALLSALVVMGSMYCLLRLWLTAFAPIMPYQLGQLFGALGAMAVLWASIQAFLQRRLKLLVAYSTVAQFGYVLLVIPLTATAGGALAWAGGVWLLAAHALAKAALFLGTGLILHAHHNDRIDTLGGAARQMPVVIGALGLAGLTLMGLPPSGGFVAKWLLLQAALEAGQWWWIPVLVGGGFLAAAYVFRILNPAFREPEGETRFDATSRIPQVVCLSMAVGSVLMGLYAEPWIGALMAGTVGGGGGE